MLWGILPELCIFHSDLYNICSFYSGSTVNVMVTLEREDEITGPVIAPFFPQVSLYMSHIFEKYVGLAHLSQLGRTKHFTDSLIDTTILQLKVTYLDL